MDQTNKKATGRKGLIALIALAVAVAVLIALLVPAIVLLNRSNSKNDDFEQQIEDLRDQIADMSDEAEALRDQIADMSDEDEVRQYLYNALKGMNPDLTDDEINALIDRILSGETITTEPDDPPTEPDDPPTEPDDPVDPPVTPALSLEDSLNKGKSAGLTANHTLSKDVNFPAKAKATLNLNGFTLTIPEEKILAVLGELNIVGKGKIIVKAGLGEDDEIQGIVVEDRGALNLKKVTLTMTGASAYGIVNEGTATVDGCDFIVGKDSTGFNCLIYNESTMIVKNSSFTEEATPKGYAYGAPIHNRGVLDMINVDIESTGYCTSSFGGKITVDSGSTLVLKGEKSLTPDGDYFAYNVHNFNEPTSNDCAEFKYLGEAEVNQINRDFKELFKNGGSITLTKDAEIGSAFSAMSGKDITIDLGGKTLTFNENAYLRVSTDLVTFKNGTLIVETDSDDTLQCIEVLSSGSLSMEGVEFINKSASAYAISNSGNLAINNSDFSISADKLGAGLTFVNNLGVAAISNSSFGNTAPDAKYTRCTPIDNYGRELTLNNVKIDSLSCCIYIAGTDVKIQLVDCELNCGATAAEICTLKVNKGDIEHTVTRTENGAAKEVTFFYH